MLVGGKCLGQQDLYFRFLRGAMRLNPSHQRSVPSGDLNVFLEGLERALFEPMGEASLPHLTMTTVLLLALASVKRVGDLDALSVSNECLEFGPSDSYVVHPWLGAQSFHHCLQGTGGELAGTRRGEEAPAPALLCPVRPPPLRGATPHIFARFYSLHVPYTIPTGKTNCRLGVPLLSAFSPHQAIPASLLPLPERNTGVPSIPALLWFTTRWSRL